MIRDWKSTRARDRLVCKAANHAISKSPEFKRTELKADHEEAPARWPQAACG
jgi:hypothetical protein